MGAAILVIFRSQIGTNCVKSERTKEFGSGDVSAMTYWSMSVARVKTGAVVLSPGGHDRRRD